MKTALISELMIWKDSIIKVSAFYLLIGVIFGIFNENPWTATAMVSCMFAIGSSLSGPVADEKNDWMVGRLCLPVSRKDVVLGRYAATTIFVVIGLVLGLIATALCVVICQMFLPGNEIVAFAAEGDMIPVSIFAAMFAVLIVGISSGIYYPLSFAFGNKKALRWVPVAVCLVVVFGIALADSNLAATFGIMPALEKWFEASVVPGIFAIAILYVVVMAISCLISVKLYEKREM